MIKIARHWIPTILALSVILLTLAFVACGGNEEARENVPTATTAGETPGATSPTGTAAGGTPRAASTAATPVAETPSASGVSLDEYLVTVCGGQAESTDWEEGESLRELSLGLRQFIETMESLGPPSEVSDWHDAGLEFQRAFKKTVDDYLEDPKGQTEDEFLLSMFFTLASDFEPVERAIAGMDPDVRSRMIEAGCIDEDLSGAVPAEPERTEILVGGSVDGELAAPDQPAFLEFQAEMGQKYLIEVAWEGFPELYVQVKDPPDPVVDSIVRWNPESSPLIGRWTAPESGTFHIDLGAYEGAGAYVISISRDPSPNAPASVSAAWEGSELRVSWEPAEGAEYYKVYHDDLGPGCRLNDEGRPIFCDELASDVVVTSYTHAAPDPGDNFYWVVACNSEGGCSRIDSYNPASP